MRYLLLGLLMLLTFTSTAAFAQDPTPTPTLFDSARYDNLPEAINLAGYPQIGFPSAPVSVVIYGAFDDLASGQFYRESYPTLVQRLHTGEIRITYVPLTGRGTIPTGRGAARAALCAAEQNRFFLYHDLLFMLQAQYLTEAFAGARLIEAANQLGLDRTRWDACMVSDRPDNTLQNAESLVQSLPLFGALPFVTINEVPTLTDPSSLNAGIAYEVARNVSTFEAILSGATEEPTPFVSDDPLATAEPTPLVLEIDPLAGDQIPPPFTIDLPAGWRFGYNAIVLQDLDALRVIPLAIYTGPVTGGTGTIVLLWGFPNVLPATGAAATDESVPVNANLFTDGLRLLRLAVVEPTCNIGTDLRRDYSVGGLAASGTQFAAVDCPSGLPDTRGWFAGLQQFSLNFVFYAYAEPISAMDGAAAGELQAILDTVRFELPEATATPTTP